MLRQNLRRKTSFPLFMGRGEAGAVSASLQWAGSHTAVCVHSPEATCCMDVYSLEQKNVSPPHPPHLYIGTGCAGFINCYRFTRNSLAGWFPRGICLAALRMPNQVGLPSDPEMHFLRLMNEQAGTCMHKCQRARIMCPIKALPTFIRLKSVATETSTEGLLHPAGKDGPS